MFVRRSKDNVGRRERTRAKRHATPKQSAREEPSVPAAVVSAHFGGGGYRERPLLSARPALIRASVPQPTTRNGVKKGNRTNTSSKPVSQRRGRVRVARGVEAYKRAEYPWVVV